MDVRDKMRSSQASSTKKLQPLHAKSSSEHKAAQHRSIENASGQNPFGCLRRRRSKFPCAPSTLVKYSEISVALPFSNHKESRYKELRRQEAKLNLKRCGELEESVRRLRKEVNLERDRRVELVPEIKGRKAAVLAVHGPHFVPPGVCL